MTRPHPVRIPLAACPRGASVPRRQESLAPGVLTLGVERRFGRPFGEPDGRARIAHASVALAEPQHAPAGKLVKTRQLDGHASRRGRGAQLGDHLSTVGHAYGFAPSHAADVRREPGLQLTNADARHPSMRPHVTTSFKVNHPLRQGRRARPSAIAAADATERDRAPVSSCPMGIARNLTYTGDQARSGLRSFRCATQAADRSRDGPRLPRIRGEGARSPRSPRQNPAAAMRGGGGSCHTRRDYVQRSGMNADTIARPTSITTPIRELRGAQGTAWNAAGAGGLDARGGTSVTEVDHVLC